jgi:hypothetical protein
VISFDSSFDTPQVIRIRRDPFATTEFGDLRVRCKPVSTIRSFSAAVHVFRFRLSFVSLMASPLRACYNALEDHASISLTVPLSVKHYTIIENENRHRQNQAYPGIYTQNTLFSSRRLQSLSLCLPLATLFVSFI